MLRWFSVLVVVLSLLRPHTSLGAGFSVNTQGATALGQANSVIAHADDPSTVFFNPALINKLQGTQIEVGTTLISPSTTFTSAATGKEFKIKEENFFPSVLFVTHTFTDKLSAGLGVFSNFGLSNDWGNTWEGRFIATKSELTTYTINPVVSYRVTPQVAVAAGLDIVFLDAELNKMLNLPLALPDVNQKLKGSDVATGFNLGLLVDLTNDLSVGAAYRSRIKATIDGDVTHELPNGLPPLVASSLPNTSASASLELPPMANFGIAYKGLKPLTIEVGARWEGWSAFKELRIALQKPIAGNTEAVIPKDWKDIYSFNVGGRYQFQNGLALMAGYIHENGPIPDHTFEPSVPDNGSDMFTAGVDYRYKKLLLSLAYDYQKVKSRNKNNAIDDTPLDSTINPNTSANGNYRTHLHIIAASLTYAF